MATYERFRLLLQQHLVDGHRPDRWECAVLDRVIVALRLSRGSATPDEAENWNLLAASYLDFYEREHRRSPRTMEHMAAAERPVTAFLKELEELTSS